MTDGIYINGPALTIDGNQWEAGSASNFSVTGAPFCNQTVTLNPATDANRAQMIRCSNWSNYQDGLSATMSSVPAGDYDVYLSVWEDNAATIYNILLNNQTVKSGYNSGPAGHWERLGPWRVTLAATGSIATATSGGGHANLSGLEVWKTK